MTNCEREFFKTGEKPYEEEADRHLKKATSPMMRRHVEMERLKSRT
jgi:hypothetical protein